MQRAIEYAGLDDKYTVVHGESQSSEASYIQVYGPDDSEMVIRVANHYKPGASGSGDVNIVLSDPHIQNFGDVADIIHQAFKEYIKRNERQLYA